MRTQPLSPDAIQPSLPLMPWPSPEAKAGGRLLRKRLTRAQLVNAVKAKISRRNSLRKQREALKG